MEGDRISDWELQLLTELVLDAIEQPPDPAPAEAANAVAAQCVDTGVAAKHPELAATLSACLVEIAACSAG